MSKHIYERCLEEQPHKQHEWRPGLFWRKRWCLGRELVPWLEANPNLSIITLPKGLVFPDSNLKIHKHLFRSTTHKYAKGLYLTFDCDCGIGTERYRSIFYKQMLGGSWPQ